MKWMIVFLLFPFATAAQNPAYKNLVMEGGGVRGLAYAGVISVLEEKGIFMRSLVPHERSYQSR